MKKISFLFVFILTGHILSAQFQVGHRQITYQDPARSNRDIQTEIYYPAATAGDNVAVASGQFPIVVFGHGFVMAWSSYDNIWNSLVPLGYIVAMPRTEGSISPDHQDFGLDLAFLVSKLKTEGANSSSPFYQKIAATSAIMGHSMGGGSSFLACENNTIPTVMVTLAAAVTNPSSVTAAANISIPTLVISGSEDCVAKPSDHQIPMYNALASSCKIYISIKDGGHCYFANYNFNCTFGEETCAPGGPPLSRENQQATTMNFVKPYFDYFLKGNVSSWYSFVDSLNTSTRITFIKDCNINPSAFSNDYTNPGIVTFPNPVSQLVYYQTSALSGKVNIQIFNTTQMKVYDSEIFIRNEAKTGTIDISNLSPGVYFLKFSAENKPAVISKFICY